MLDVIFYEAFKEEETALKALLPKKVKAGFTWKTVQEQGDIIPPAKIICIRTQSTIPLSWAKNIDGILSRSQGYDHLIEYRKKSKKNIPCGFLRDYCSLSVAEHAIMAMLVLLKKLKKQMKQFEQFQRDGITGIGLKGRKVLVVGVGRIGSQIAELVKGMKMQVKGVDINPCYKKIEYVSFKKGMTWADVVFSAVPLTGKTASMFDFSSFLQAKKGIVFINVSRGEVSPVKDLRMLIEKNILGGLSLDVYEDEKVLADYLRGKGTKPEQKTKDVLFLKEKDNVLCTPHNAFNTADSVQEKSKQTIAALRSFIQKREFIYNVPQE